MKLLSFLLVLFSLQAFAGSDIDIKVFLKEANRIGKIIEHESLDKSLPQKIAQSETLLKKNQENPIAYDIIAQHLTTIYSFASEYEKVLEMDNVDEKIRERQYSKPLNYTVIPALDAIIERAKKHQIVMINEAHHIAQHRVLTYNLLEALWEQGFRYFAVETLGASILPEEKIGFISQKDGYYTKEPIYANLLLKAKKIGFHLISYDSSGHLEERENKAANNLNNAIFKKDKNAKVLIHVGYAHINEQKWLAGKLKQLLGLDPLTVDQTSFMERKHTRYEHDIYLDVIRGSHSSAPLVLLQENKTIYSSNKDNWDMTVFWPRTTYKYNRPIWASLDRQHTLIKPSVCNNTFPCMIEAFRFGLEDEVPEDRIILSDKNDEKALFTTEETKYLRVTNQKGSFSHKFKK